MNSPPNRSFVWIGVIVIAAMFYLGSQRNQTEPTDSAGTNSPVQLPEATADNQKSYPPPKPAPRSFAGYECKYDCSGHQAGYEWAEEHGITDGEACDAAGEHSNSPSFAEGCHAYVDGEGDSEENQDTEDDN